MREHAHIPITFSRLTSQVWSLENLLPIQSLQRHEKCVYSLALFKDTLFSCSEDTEIKVSCKQHRVVIVNQYHLSCLFLSYSFTKCTGCDCYMCCDVCCCTSSGKVLCFTKQLLTISGISLTQPVNMQWFGCIYNTISPCVVCVVKLNIAPI